MTEHTAYKPSAQTLKTTMKSINRLQAAHELLVRGYQWMEPDHPVRAQLEDNAGRVLELIEETSRSAQELHKAVVNRIDP